MEAIALLAEVAAYGLTVLVHDGELFIVGDHQSLPPDLRTDIRNHYTDLIQGMVTA